ncbi:hypothetical protein PflCFBP13517_22955 [Pseudomonas fluorescens]|mgnify:CR=1 FL=1|nr:hypothetical protein CFT9_28632 [Pseudomonas sp. CFT9]EPL05939.1 hypothetical protein CF150_27629 [Pseudomonas sp. CF150]OKP71235.1 hypothetical protein BTR19_12325 [Pseudomonas fluorescens]TKK39226.1 hypothetical protein PflCFBP13517_22955 [Pseudomonas fluorescens]
MGQRTMEVPAGLTSSRQPVTNTLAMDFSTQLEHACESPIAVEDLHIPMPTFVTLQPRFSLGGLTLHRLDFLQVIVGVFYALLDSAAVGQIPVPS